jgi:hypothetical protein
VAVADLKSISSAAEARIAADFRRNRAATQRRQRDDNYNQRYLPSQVNKGPERGKKRKNKNQANRLAQKHAKLKRQMKNGRR